MTNTFRIALAQINCTVGDLGGNCGKMLEYVEKARDQGADLISFPELAVTGYPPEDLLLKPKFVEDNLTELRRLASRIRGIAAIIGFVDKNRRGIYNAAAVICDGTIKGICHKVYLPNYAVFDEKRYFRSGKNGQVFALGTLPFGVNICEDIWYMQGPARKQAMKGAALICNINASPYHVGKIKIREEIVRNQAVTHNVAVAYTNLVGGQDELVFDGQSMIVDRTGKLIARADAFKEDLLCADLEVEEAAPQASGNWVSLAERCVPPVRKRIPAKVKPPLEPAHEIYSALVLGLHDYVRKNGFKKVVIGLSGGVDSALVAVLAADALGKENVICVFMPSRFSSPESEIDAHRLADNVGLQYLVIPIEGTHTAYLEMLEKVFAGLPQDITEENIQARIRGNILMALSNKFGWLVLTTGNKSEMSVGYATLYGDMAGGYAVIKDVPKTVVYVLGHFRNSLGEAIPERILTRAPSAELKPDQKDTDSLPPYDLLDPVLRAYIEEDEDPGRIVQAGHGPEVVERAIRMVDVSEYKRRQAPPGIRITPKAFGKDRRMPITNKYKG